MIITEYSGANEYNIICFHGSELSLGSAYSYYLKIKSFSVLCSFLCESVRGKYFFFDMLKEPLGMRLFNFFNFENLLHVKLYSLLVLNKIQKNIEKTI